ncbi:transcriptional regulator [Phyllobacterium brassicacearum]|uniref:Transcriptional regulator n=1 Tax=Phyllobacterium brassicacearum TaxID=314235 RepID=A0A2P7BUE0_9HYPH|nr:helix-turn-helix domain-containing protein [Phyllobacterium brassicacearum]PSH70051.1 transcriptional regulator [Phyllobacterium brassicacearum]TDQ34092.1 CRP/FNR family nitrogen fixation transcriptional regulator [Phyllobacterium brassicacearum]
MLAYTTIQMSAQLRSDGGETPIIPLPFCPHPQQINFFAPGSEIYAQGEKAVNIYQVEFGAVRIYRLLADGRRQISAFHLSGEIFGLEADANHHFFAEAITGTNLRVFPRSKLGDISQELFSLTLRSLTRAQEHLLVLGRQTAAERVAAFLLDLAERQGGLEQIEMPMSRMDIGDYLGLTIETVSRVFSKLKDTGIIALPTLRSAEIRKWNALQAMCE